MSEFDDLWHVLATELTTVLGGYRDRIADLPITTKPDKTLLTDADLEVEGIIAARIREFDPAATLVGEEDGRTDDREELADDGRLFVIDPIDGTAEFVRADHREFCSVVCVLEQRRPVAAFVLAPELGPHETPLTITCHRPAGLITVNGENLGERTPGPAPRRASVTRSAGTTPRSFEAHLMRAGFELKTRTTSQTLDMVRTAVDLSPWAGPGTPRFDLFFRPKQKIWDGLAGVCLGETAGLRAVDLAGNERVPVAQGILRAAEPTFDFTVLGVPEAVEWFLTIA